MRGHVRRRGDSWCVVVDLPRSPITGKRRQKWHSGYRTKREAETAVADILTKLDQNLYVGVRYDWLEELADASQETQTLGAFVTYYTTEFLRFRVGLEHNWSDLAELDGSDTGFVELNFIYGSHPAEPYWVNR